MKRTIAFIAAMSLIIGLLPCAYADGDDGAEAPGAGTEEEITVNGDVLQIQSDELVELYVSPEQDLTGEGTAEEPLGGFEAAMEKISEIAGTTKLIRVYFYGGDYYFGSTAEITDELLKDSSLELLAYNDEEVEFKGSELIQPDEWQKYKDNIYSAQIGAGRDFDMLFCNEEQQVMARYPNYKENEILNGYSADCISPERVKNWSHPETGYIRAIHANEWGGNSYRITGKDSQNNLTYELGRRP